MISYWHTERKQHEIVEMNASKIFKISAYIHAELKNKNCTIAWT